MTEAEDRTTASGVEATSTRTHADATAATSAAAALDVGEAEACGPDEGAARARTLPSGWYLLGLAVQVFLWFLVFLGIAIAIGVGGHLTEFRYVGF